MLIFRKTSRFIRISVWLNREFVTGLQCKKAAEEVETGMHKAGVTQ